MFQSHIQLHRLAIALNLERHGIARIRVRGDQIRELDFPVKRIDVVSVLIDVIVTDRGHDVANLQTAFVAGVPGSTLVT